MRPRIGAVLSFLGLVCAFGSPLVAQELTLASAAPRFLSTPTAVTPAADVSNAPVFQRRVTLEMDRVPLKSVLDAIGQQTGLSFIASPETLSLDALVSVSASHITVAAALTELLVGKGVDVELARDGAHAAIVPRAGAVRPLLQAAQRGVITGHVIDAALHTPLAAVSLRVEGTTFGVTADADGRYSISGVSPGSYRVTARRVGYQPLSKDVTVSTDQTVTLDFALTAAPTRLDEVVTTAVGQQRRYEVGNDISTINADSIAPTAPITSLTDLISARAPGVTVLETSGLTGAGEAIRIEGLTSLALQNDPIVIVDGIREDNSPGGQNGTVFGYTGFGGLEHPTPTRLNDLDFSDVESIDVLKGPAASTEYGTDAANGVIVITTKHGTSGAPQWKASAEQTVSDIPESFPNKEYSWGHTTNGLNQSVDCPLTSPYGGAYQPYYATTFGSTTGQCVVDSVIQWNPLNHSATSVFGTGQRAKYDLSVSGGSDAARYFVAGGLSNETGIVKMPPVFREVADTEGIGLPGSVLNPNGEGQRSVRANVAMRLGSTADMSASASYMSTFQQTPDAGYLYGDDFDSPALSDAAHNYGYGVPGDNYGSPLGELAELGSQNTDRVTGGLTANWRPVSWFVGHATAGLDHGSQVNRILNVPQIQGYVTDFNSLLGIANSTTDIYSVDLRGSATATLTQALRAVTSAGFQVVDNRTQGEAATTYDISATNLTLNGATSPTVTQQSDRSATMGGYGEEQLSVADRLFLTGALRVDAGSGFGRTYATAAYPKASVSWLAISNGATNVRLRGAFGEAGVQPSNGAALLLYTPSVGYLNGAAVNTGSVQWPGDPSLRPERTAEIETGVDVDGWHNRLSVELTYYQKHTYDALVNEQLGWDLNDYTYQENIGEVQNTGVEGVVTASVLQSRSVTWTVSLNASVNQNKLISLAPGVTTQGVAGWEAQFRQVVGYPLYGIWAQRVSYADANHDGIIEDNEVTVANSSSYVGSSLPTREVSISTHLGLLRGMIALGGLIDYRGGYRIANAEAYDASQRENYAAENYPTAPLWLQARSVASGVYDGSIEASPAPYVEDGTFVRFRELSVTYALPLALARAAHMGSLSLTGAVRNLALWTRYTGIDPEVTNAYGGNVQSSPTTNGVAVNNDVREDFGAVPLARYWVLRLNIGV